MKKIYSPFTDEQVIALNRFQNIKAIHPFTCCSYNGCNRDENKDGVLIATNSGWVCPCGKYKQKWAWQEMVDIGANEKN